MINRVIAHKLYLIGGLLGAVAGFIYWKYWGCLNGCSITSSPLNSILYFALVGALTIGSFTKKRK